MQKIPNFFIIGAAKSGTTSLFKYLEAHPDVYFSPIKEPNYFCTDIKVEEFTSIYKKNNLVELENYFAKDNLERIQLAFVRDQKQYDRLFNAVDGEKAVGEASTSYLFSKEAAQNIFNYNPSSKIIAILRNPIERTYSHYQMALRYGYTALPFREALQKDISQTKKGWGISELFIELGLYFESLKRYYDLFPADRIKVFLFDDLKTNPQALISECFQFLDLPFVGIDTKATHNPARIPKFKFINKIVYQSGFKNFLVGILPVSTKNWLSNRFFEKGNKKSFTKADKEFLSGYFKEDIQRTENLIDKDLSAWMNI